MTLETLRSVTNELNGRNIPACLEYPGWLYIEAGDGLAFAAGAGEARDTFDIDAYKGKIAIEDGSDPFETIKSTIPRDSNDVGAIVDFIVCSLEERQ